jgi:hypothetical protein
MLANVPLTMVSTATATTTAVTGSGTEEYIPVWSTIGIELADSPLKVPNADSIDAWYASGANPPTGTWRLGLTQYNTLMGATASPGSFNMANNAKWAMYSGSGAWLYVADGPASLLYHNAGEIHMLIAASGYAGGVITWSDRLTIGSSGVSSGGTVSGTNIDSSGNTTGKAAGNPDGSGSTGMIAEWSDSNTLTTGPGYYTSPTANAIPYSNASGNIARGWVEAPEVPDIEWTGSVATTTQNAWVEIDHIHVDRSVTETWLITATVNAIVDGAGTYNIGLFINGSLSVYYQSRASAWGAGYVNLSGTWRMTASGASNDELSLRMMSQTSGANMQVRGSASSGYENAWLTVTRFPQ